MSRLVIPRIVGVGQLAAEDVDRSPRDEYKERLVKYLPAESVAFYAFADKLLIDHYGLNTAGIAPTIPADAVLKFFSWLLIVLGLIGTPIYLHRQRVGKPALEIACCYIDRGIRLLELHIGGIVLFDT
jgi:hypothetical protein